LDQRRQKARILVVGIEDRVGAGVFGVVSDQIRQFKCTHAGMAGFVNDGIQRGCIGSLFLQYALGINKTGGPLG